MRVSSEHTDQELSFHSLIKLSVVDCICHGPFLSSYVAGIGASVLFHP
jgi:hypothetical protein